MARRSRVGASGASSNTSADLATVLIETYSVNDAMNQWLLANLNPRAWRAELPGTGLGGRTIAAIFAHLHNCRLVWLKGSAAHLKCPAPLDPARCSIAQAAGAHKRSAAQCVRMLTDVLSGGEKRRVIKFWRGSWTRTWPAGGTMFAYMFAHEAHHRGQILMLAHQLGFRLRQYPGIWQWDRLWKEHGFGTRPR